MRKTYKATLLMLPMLLGWTGSHAIEIVDDVYQIGSTEDMIEFVKQVNEQGDEGIHGVLTADIDYTGQNDMIGQNGGQFSGCLDGAGHTLTISLNYPDKGEVGFIHNMVGGTVKNLHVTGTIVFGGKNAGGIVNYMEGSTMLNCVSTVDFTSAHNDDLTCGGLVSKSDGGNRYENCVYKGKVTAPEGRCVGGIVGWIGSSGDKMINCLAIAEVELGTTEGCNALARYGSNSDRIKFTNCYYLNALEAIPANSTQMTEEQMKSGETCFRLNGDQKEMKFYQNLTGDNADAFPWPFDTHAQVYTAANFRCDGQLSGDVSFSNEGEVKIQPDHNFADDICTECGKKYIPLEYLTQEDDGTYVLKTLQDWRYFAAATQRGVTNMRVRMDADIEGVTADDRVDSFGGEFDGQGHKLGLSIETAEENAAPFKELTDYAVVKNLWTTGSIKSTAKYACGIAANMSQATLQNCICSATIEVELDGDGTFGGLAGKVWTASTFENCVFAGSVYSENAHSFSGIAAYERTGHSMFRNCLVATDDITVKDSESRNFYITREKTADNYYVNNMYVEHAFLSEPARGKNKQVSFDQLETGLACWMLNGDQSSICFYQNLGGEEPDLFPLPFDTHARVYASGVFACTGEPYGTPEFSNEECAFEIEAHNYVGGYCDKCGEMDPDFEGTEPTQEDGWCLIATAEELLWFSKQVKNGTSSLQGRLTADIDLTGIKWTPIGWSPENGSFWGTFDGQGHTVSGLTMDGTETNSWKCIGLFGSITHGTLKNLTVKGSITTTFTEGCCMVGVVARAWDAKITNVHSYLNINVKGGGYYGVGGIAGFSHDETVITDCSFDGTLNVNNGDAYGGIAGNSWGATYNDCACYGRINLNSGKNAGGILGTADNANCVVTNCFAAPVFNTAEGTSALVNNVSNINAEKCLNNYWVEGTASKGFSGDLGSTCVTAEEAASGKVAYDLNQGQEDNHWFQTLGEDKYPVLDNSHKKVTLTEEGQYINKGDIDPAGIEPALVEGVYQIGKVEELLWFANAVNAGQAGLNAVLTKDIDMSEYTGEWNPIGVCPEHDSYQGVFDGQGHAVKNLVYNKSVDGWTCVGMFGCVVRGTVKNLTVKGDITCAGGGCSMIGLVGRAWGANLEHLTSALNITLDGNGFFGVGGLVGYGHDDTKISECVYSGTLKANNSTDCVGGIIGRAAAATVNNSANLGELTCKDCNCILGGIVGWGGDANFGGFMNCMNAGTVKFSGESEETSGHAFALAGALSDVVAPNCVNNYWKEGSATAATNIELAGATLFNADQQANGTVCFGLNQGQEAEHWYQTLGVDAYPVLDNTRERVIMGGNGGYINPGSINPLGIEPELVDGVYQIQTLENLIWFSVAVNGGNGGIKGVLTADIDMAPFDGWTPIGKENGCMFSGQFDGQGHTLCGFHYTLTEGEYGGLFGVACWGSIKNFTLKGTLTDATITTDFSYCGVLARSWGAQVEGIHSELDITTNLRNYHGIGGVVGYMHDGGTVNDCSFSGTITTGDNGSATGGVLGRAAKASMNNCGFFGTINFEGTDCYAGGIIGDGNDGQFEGMKNCVSAGVISSTNNDQATNNGALASILSETANSMSENNYWLEGTAGRSSKSGMASATQVDEKTMLSGEVAYKLNNGQEAMHWYQRIGSDKHPYLDADHGVVLKTEEGYQNEGINPDGVAPELVNDVYQIRNVENLLWFSLNINKSAIPTNCKAVLVKDIDLSPIESWTPIGVCPEHDSFQGEFDGQGYKVTNLNINARFGDWPCVGLFGAVVHGTVKNLTVEGKLTCVSGACAMYGVIGRAWDAKLSHIHSSLEIEPKEGGYFGVGGIVGYAHDNTLLDDCQFDGTIHVNNGDRYGGIVGNAALVHATNCANYGTIEVNDAGALVGGIYGCADNADNTVNRCLNAGNITAEGGFIGSLVGLIYSISAESGCNYWLDSTSNRAAGGDMNATSATAEEMASGAVTYALNDGQEATHWYQTLGTDAYPMLDETRGVVNKSGEGYINTAVNGIREDREEEAIYTLSGVRVQKATKGLFIKGGKKMLVK